MGSSEDRFRFGIDICCLFAYNCRVRLAQELAFDLDRRSILSLLMLSEGAFRELLLFSYPVSRRIPRITRDNPVKIPSIDPVAVVARSGSSRDLVR
jgi:hypothetical protein